MRTALPLPCELEGYRVALVVYFVPWHHPEFNIMYLEQQVYFLTVREPQPLSRPLLLPSLARRRITNVPLGRETKHKGNSLPGEREGRCVGGHESSFQSSDDFYEIHSKKAPFDVTAD